MPRHEPFRAPQLIDALHRQRSVAAPPTPSAGVGRPGPDYVCDGGQFGADGERAVVEVLNAVYNREEGSARPQSPTTTISTTLRLNRQECNGPTYKITEVGSGTG